ncbi:MAG TPA: APC family permease [Casimicrobiaceae bacterium]|nr:APC family permease [Casimicrobiaceae bacterium]
MSGPTTAPSAPATRLLRKLGVADAVVIGLGSMIGAGIFAALAPAAAAAGPALLVGLMVAAFVAYCNATSSAALAALYPESGGTYVYGRRRLGAFWGFLAGWGFVTGKLASCAAMALTFAAYAAPAFSRPLAILAVIALTAVNYFGISRTVLATRVIVAVVLACLAVVVFAAAFGGNVDVTRAIPGSAPGIRGILQAAGFLFFAFAGYARIATLGEEVIDPARTIPRAIPLALGLTLLVYAAVAISALVTVDARDLAGTRAPLVHVVESGRWSALAPAVRIGAAIASLGVLLSLLAGVSRTAFAMAGNRDLPRFLASVHARHRVPDHAELAAGAIVALIVLIADVRDAIGFSSFAVLVYYAIANASAVTLRRDERRWPRALAIAGLAGCALVAISLPWQSILEALVLLLAGAAVYAMRRRQRSSGAQR